MKPVMYLVRALPGQDLEPLRPYVVRGGAPTAPPRERVVEAARGATILAPTYIDRVDVRSSTRSRPSGPSRRTASA